MLSNSKSLGNHVVSPEEEKETKLLETHKN